MSTTKKVKLKSQILRGYKDGVGYDLINRRLKVFWGHEATSSAFQGYALAYYNSLKY